MAAGCGISKVRITGGEPLVRYGCADLVAMLARTSGIEDISLTTNGLLLPRFAGQLREAGLHRVNISLDSLEERRFAEVTRGGRLDEALAGLDAAFAAGSRRSRSTRCCSRASRTSSRRSSTSRASARSTCASSSSCRWTGVSAGAAGSCRRRRCSSACASCTTWCPHEGPFGHGPAQYWQVPGAQGTIGFIAGVSEHFCESCNRLRLTADGRLRTCLFSGEETAVRPLIGSPDGLRGTILAAVAGKSYDRCVEQRANERAMSADRRLRTAGR